MTTFANNEEILDASTDAWLTLNTKTFLALRLGLRDEFRSAVLHGISEARLPSLIIARDHSGAVQCCYVLIAPPKDHYAGMLCECA